MATPVPQAHNESLSVLTETFPQDQHGKKHSICRVPSHGKLNAVLMSILREDGTSRQLGSLWDKLLPNLCTVTCKATCTVSRAVSSWWAKIQRETWICTKKAAQVCANEKMDVLNHWIMELVRLNGPLETSKYNNLLRLPEQVAQGSVQSSFEIP